MPRMTQEQSEELFQKRLKLYNLTKEFGNRSKAVKIMGFCSKDRARQVEFKVLRYGTIEALHPSFKGKKRSNHEIKTWYLNAIDSKTELSDKQIRDLILKNYGILVSPKFIRYLLCE